MHLQFGIKVPKKTYANDLKNSIENYFKSLNFEIIIYTIVINNYSIESNLALFYLDYQVELDYFIKNKHCNNETLNFEFQGNTFYIIPSFISLETAITPKEVQGQPYYSCEIKNYYKLHIQQTYKEPFPQNTIIF